MVSFTAQLFYPRGKSPKRNKLIDNLEKMAVTHHYQDVNGDLGRMSKAVVVACFKIRNIHHKGLR
jgi:hypothetical protein